MCIGNEAVALGGVEDMYLGAEAVSIGGDEGMYVHCTV
jgi:hypothetical protein